MADRSVQVVDRLGVPIFTADGNDGMPKGRNGWYISDWITVQSELLAASVDKFIWRCYRGVWQIIDVHSNITVSGGSNAAVMPVHCAGGVAIASGTAQLSAALDLEETPPNMQVGTLIATPNKFYPGDVLGLDFSGTLTALVGAITIALARVE